MPAGVTLDGAGHRITLAGHAENFDSAGVRVRGGAVADLIIDGRDLDEACPNYLAALVFGGPGVVRNVTVENVRFGADRDHGTGIEVAVFDGAAVELRDITVRNIGGTAMVLVGDGTVRLIGGAVRDVTRDLQTTQWVAVARGDSRGAAASGVTGAGWH